jgi:transcription elongation factor Elf1
MKANKKDLYKFGQTDRKDDKVVISSEYYTNLKPEYLCSFCNTTLVRLTDAGQNNQTYWCRQCSIEYDPEAENLRKVTKVGRHLDSDALSSSGNQS